MNEKIYKINIERKYPLPTPQEIQEELPHTEEITDSIFQSRTAVTHILKRNDRRLMVICGPCSIDNLDSALEYAQRFKALQERVGDKFYLVMRAYFEKPRTTVGWKGMLYDPDLDQSFNIEKGLRMARQLLIKLAEMNIPAATEFLEPIIPQYIADLITWASIGASTQRSTNSSTPRRSSPLPPSSRRRREHETLRGQTSAAADPDSACDHLFVLRHDAYCGQ